jgi:uncharacterized membrane protein YkoI
MDKHRLAITAAAALGVAAGGYGIASAASGNGTTTTTPSTTQSAPSTQSAPTAPSAQQPWGRQRSDETPLTGDALSKVTAIAKAKVPGGTVIRVETDADGNATYEAHMVKSDGTAVTVHVDKDFNFVSLETGGPGGGPGGHAGFGGPPPQQQSSSGGTA